MMSWTTGRTASYRRPGADHPGAAGRRLRARPRARADRGHRRAERLRAAAGAAPGARGRGGGGVRAVRPGADHRRRARRRRRPDPDAVAACGGVLGRGGVSARLRPAGRPPGAAARPAARPRPLPPDAAPARTGLAVTVGTCLALTWLNPHVYLDTVLLLGSMAATYGRHRWQFAAGAGLGSAVWFTALGYGARLLRPVFTRPAAWQILDGLIAAVMTALALSLTLRGLNGA